jgi:hypothetical protein
VIRKCYQWQGWNGQAIGISVGTRLDYSYHSNRLLQLR